MKHTLDYKSDPQYSTYKKRHKDKFSSSTSLISKEEFEEMSLKSCCYCGVIGPNGIDRVDSDKGYEKSNCAPCCKHCNYTKGNLSLSDFEIWKNRFVVFQSKNIKFICFVVLSVLVSGCKPAQQEEGEESSEPRTSQPRHFKKTSDVSKNFNRDVHVVDALVKELENSVIQGERRELLLTTLQTKISEINDANADLTAEDKEVLRKAEIALKQGQ